MTLSLDSLNTRLTLLEDAVIQLQSVLNNVASTEAVRQLNAIRQQDIDSLQTDVDALETAVEILRAEVFK